MQPQGPVLDEGDSNRDKKQLPLKTDMAVSGSSVK